MGVVHPIGSCYSNGQEVYIHIPKCASTSIKETLGWKLTTEWVNRPCPLPGFVVVRDPADRFFSGVAEHAKRNRHHVKYDQLLDRVEAGGHPVFDEHTMRQSDFVLSTFTNLEVVRMENVSSFIADRYGTALKHVNSRDWTPRESVLPIIRRYYRADYELYES